MPSTSKLIGTLRSASLPEGLLFPMLAVVVAARATKLLSATTQTLEWPVRPVPFASLGPLAVPTPEIVPLATVAW